MICPRCSVGEISETTQECLVCGFSRMGGVVVDSSDWNRLEDPELPALERQFQVEGVLHRGTAARIYLARDHVTGRLCSLKVLPLPEDIDPDAVDRFRQDAQRAATLDHPHIVTVLRFGATDSALWYAMEYCQGRSLGDLLRSADRMELRTCLRLVEQIASALDYGHRRGVSHGNLKPSNVLVDPEGWSRVGDFGTNSAFGPLPRRQPELSFEENYGHVAPERYGPDGMVGPAADQYALAVLAFTCLARRSPFVGETFEEITRHHLQGPVPLLAETRPDLPAHVSATLARAMSRQPGARFSGVLDFVTALAGAPVAEPVPVVPVVATPVEVVPVAAAVVVEASEPEAPPAEASEPEPAPAPASSAAPLAEVTATEVATVESDLDASEEPEIDEEPAVDVFDTVTPSAPIAEGPDEDVAAEVEAPTPIEVEALSETATELVEVVDEEAALVEAAVEPEAVEPEAELPEPDVGAAVADEVALATEVQPALGAPGPQELAPSEQAVIAQAEPELEPSAAVAAPAPIEASSQPPEPPPVAETTPALPEIAEPVPPQEHARPPLLFIDRSADSQVEEDDDEEEAEKDVDLLIRESARQSRLEDEKEEEEEREEEETRQEEPVLLFHAREPQAASAAPAGEGDEQEPEDAPPPLLLVNEPRIQKQGAPFSLRQLVHGWQVLPRGTRIGSSAVAAAMLLGLIWWRVAAGHAEQRGPDWVGEGLPPGFTGTRPASPGAGAAPQASPSAAPSTTPGRTTTGTVALRPAPTGTRDTVKATRPPVVSAEPAHLFINATPWGQLFIDDHPVGNTPKADLQVPAGMHRIRITRDGYRPYETEIAIEAGETLRLTDIVLEEKQ